MSDPSTSKNADLPEELRPCEHLTTLVSRRADNTLKGPAKVYMDLHVLTCPHCRAAIEGLRALNAQIEELTKTSDPSHMRLGEEDWQRVDEAMNAGQ